MGIFVFVEKGRGFFGLNFWESQMVFSCLCREKGRGVFQIFWRAMEVVGVFFKILKRLKCLVFTNVLGHTHIFREGKEGFQIFVPSIRH